MRHSASPETLAALSRAARQARRFRTLADQKTAERDRLILQACSEGMSQAKAGKVAGITVQRVEQIVKRDREREAARAAELERYEGVFDDVREFFAQNGGKA